MKKIITIVVAVVFVGGVGAAAAYYAYNTFFNPQAELARMVEAMQNVDSVKFDGAAQATNVEVEKTDDLFSEEYGMFLGDGSEDVTIEAEGVLVSSGEEEFDLAVKFSLTSDEEDAEIAAEIRKINKVVYLKIDEIGELGDMLGADFGEQWIMFDEDQFGDLTSEFAEEPDDELTPKQEAELEALLKSSKVISVVTASVTELVNGHATRVYEVVPNPEGIRSYTQGSIRIIEEREPTSDELEEIEEFIDAIEDLTGKLWIEVGTHLLHRASVNGEVETPDGSSFDLTATVELTDHNEDLEIEKPEDALSFAEMIGAAFGEMFGGLPMAEEGFSGTEVDTTDDETGFYDEYDYDYDLEELEDYVTDSDGDGLPDMTEGFYGSDINNPDTDGDGVNDGDEVANGDNPTGSGSLFNFGLPELE